MNRNHARLEYSANFTTSNVYSIRHARGTFINLILRLRYRMLRRQNDTHLALHHAWPIMKLFAIRFPFFIAICTLRAVIELTLLQ